MVEFGDTTKRTLRPTSRGKIVGRSQVLVDLVGNLDRVARANCTVLITGESGTGKEMLVAALHEASPRREGPLVTLNCGAVPEGLLESELFGHAKGAFTGAHAARQGRVAAAEGGTLFLDEVGEMPLSLQVKLLRLLQQREYSPVGDTRTLRCDIRIAAATNRDLEAEVRAGRFREDLYYRLNVIHLNIPALRERRGDIGMLATHFLVAMKGDLGRDDLLGFDEGAVAALEAHTWPGNIRELQNIVERAVLLSPGPMIGAADLPVSVRSSDPRREQPPAGLPETLPDTGIDLRAVLAEYEATLIRQALMKTGGNKTRAAELLGLNRTTLVEMVKRLGIAA